uniref:PAP-associated domain-containing protein n=1 Tax=Timema bartmani TaxID=61472 RepID=A0A7R9EYD6_9NEOP|nr:unnamed protein product [Timema bartmani]
MYHAMFPPYVYTHLTGQQNHQQYSSNANRQSHHIFGSNPHLGPSIDLLQLMGIEMPPIRTNRGYEHGHGGRGGGWRERGNHHSNNVQVMPPPSHPAYRQPHNNQNGKKNLWNNKNTVRPPRCTVQQDTNMSDTTYNSDSGFSSRSPTPIKLQQGDQSNLEENSKDSSTNSSSGDSGKGVKRVYHEVYSNTNLPHYSNSTSSNGYQTPPPVPPHPPPPITSAQQFYHHVPPPPAPIFYGYPIYGQQQQQAPQQPRRSDGHDQSVYTGGGNNNHNKRRYQSGRFSPPMLYKNRLQEMKEPPKELLTGGEWDNRKCTHTRVEKPTLSTPKQDLNLDLSIIGTPVHALDHLAIESAYPRYGLYLVGSTISGFGSDNSDVDMCLLVRHTEMDQRSEAVGHLEELLMCLRRCDFVTQPELIQAKVPILKFRDHRRGLDVDLNCNNSVGIRNTHLLHCYAQPVDWRVRPLVLVVKLWAHRHNINDAKNMTISSYSLVLMVIHFLQCGVSPAVLPCLHDMYQGKFSPQSDVQHIDVHEVIPIFQSENKQTLGELLLAFLRYFVEFDFSQYALSVRLAARIPIEECRRARAYKNDPHQWKYLCIEEPFDLTNTARSVYDRDVFESVKEVFMNSYNQLKKTKDIERIFRLDDKD